MATLDPRLAGLIADLIADLKDGCIVVSVTDGVVAGISRTESATFDPPLLPSRPIAERKETCS